MNKEIIYVGSFNPAHLSHKNTLEKAQNYFEQPVKVCICKNELKTTEFFSLPERLEFAKDIFGEETDIDIYEGYKEIQQLLYDAQSIVRGYRNYKDYLYCYKLGFYYRVLNLKGKVTFIDVDPLYQDISSTKVKQQLYAEEPDMSLLNEMVGESGTKKLLQKVNYLQ